MRQVVGVVLAGGRSQRFGSDKALAELDGETLVQRAAKALYGSCTEVAVSVGDCPDRAGALVAIEDSVVGGPPGPVGGLAAGALWAQSTGADVLCFVACDLVSVDAHLVGSLVQKIFSIDCDTNIVVVGDQTRFCLFGALKPSGFLDQLSQVVDTDTTLLGYGVKRPSVRSWFESLGGNFVSPASIGATPSIYHNINTKEELKVFQATDPQVCSVRLFAQLAELAGTDRIQVEATTTDEVLAALALRLGPACTLPIRLGVNGELVASSTRLTGGEEISAFPPFAGG